MDAPADKVVIMHYPLKTTLAKHNSEKVTERVVFRQLALYNFLTAPKNLYNRKERKLVPDLHNVFTEPGLRLTFVHPVRSFNPDETVQWALVHESESANVT